MSLACERHFHFFTAKCGLFVSFHYAHPNLRFTAPTHVCEALRTRWLSNSRANTAAHAFVAKENHCKVSMKSSLPDPVNGHIFLSKRGERIERANSSSATDT